GRVGMGGPAALFLPLMTGGVTGCAGMAGQRAPVLHALAGCAILRRALRLVPISNPAAAATVKSLLTMEGGSFGSCRSTADLGRSALLSRLGPTPGPARRSLGETGAALTVGPQHSPDPTYFGTTWTLQNLGFVAQ